jgi:hypothetical protein
VTRNKQLFYQDPTETTIPNEGVSKVVRPETEQQWRVLEWELKSFVCEGEYERGLDRILGSFLSNLGQSQQPAVWVSGFYGSGKSHLCRVLEYLWRDVQLPSGESARSLVTLPNEIDAHLRELSTQGKRRGGLWSAAGTLGAGTSQAVRLAFLSVLFESAGLPTQYPHARFTIWARNNGYLDGVQRAVQAAGKEYSREIIDLFVSPIISKALLEADPTLGESSKDVRTLLRAQFPERVEDVTDDQMFAAIEDVLRMQSNTEGRYPLTLVVLDEMQQYLGDDHARTLAVQNIVEGVSSRFENSVLFVATGQSAMGGTSTLEKLTDRFPVHVHLSDTDVETVVRQVILRKKPDMRAGLQATLEQVSGEIDRHLGGTRIQPVAADRQDLVADYPLLPARRRFWELALRALDKAGRAGVLRTQLRIVHEATREVADDPLGHVVGADFIYDQQAAALQQSGVLLKEIDELIRGLKQDGPDGELKARICALIFLISHLPSQVVGMGDIGLRASAPFIADLLVEDLTGGGAEVRRRVPELLEELVNAGRLMRIDDAYALQTEEGAEWEKEFRGRLTTFRDDPGKLATLRNERLYHAVEEALGGLKLTHGRSRTPRRIALHFGADEPTGDETGVAVWIRDEWSVAEGEVRNAAARAGEASPIVHVLLPKQGAEAIKDALASHAAAQETLHAKPTPQTAEGKEAQRAMKGRIADEEERVDRLLGEVVARGRVYQGGGNEVSEATFRESVETAADRSLVRLFPKFGVADDPNWGKVVTRARDGAPDALQAVGFSDDPPAHAVCKEVLATISAGGTKGAVLDRRFSDPPYGWPQDAIRGATMALLATRHVRAAQDGVNLDTPKQLEPRQIGKTVFYKEDPPPSMTERMAVRGLLAHAGIPYENGQEQVQIPALMQKLLDLAADAGGPPPLPDAPDTAHVAALQALGGNQQFRAVAAAREQLKQDLTDWFQAAQRRERRLEEWSALERLIAHAGALDAAAEVQKQYQAIRSGRQLLDEPDPVQPLIDELSGRLRAQVKERATRLAEAHERATADLGQEELWNRLGPTDRDAILENAGLVESEAPDVSSDTKLLRALDEAPLSTWDERIRFVDARADQAREAAAKQLEPLSVSVKSPTATIRTASDLDAYLEQVRGLVEPHLDEGETVIIS